jgi:Neuraminidase (sialidase)
MVPFRKLIVVSLLALAPAAFAKGAPAAAPKAAAPKAAAAATVLGEGKHPSIAADKKGGLHAAYEAAGEGGTSPDIWYVASTDGGKTWSKPADVSATPGASGDPAIATGKDGSVVVVWTDTSSGQASPDIYFARSGDGGKTWSKPADISNSPGASSEPDVKVADDGTIHVVWLDTSAGDASPDVWASASHDQGKTWDKPQNVSNTPGKSATPAIAVGADKAANVVWTDTTSGAASPDVFFSRSTDGGKTWSKAVDISNTPGASMECDIAVDDKGAIFVDWTDTSTGDKSPDVMVVSSKDGGKTWSKPVDASNTPGVSSDPAIAAAGDGKLAVVWVDTSEGAASPDVFMASSGNGGKAFGKAHNISNTPGVSKEPDITVAGTNIVAVWEEEEGGKTYVKMVSVAK